MEEKQRQSLTVEELFYFFLRLRKSEVRRTVQTLKSRYPDETPEQLAGRLTAAKAQLALLGGGLLSLPLALPGLGQALKLAGFVGATSMLTRMHLYLILEIALLFDKDIDDRSRVPEMMAVVAATGLASAAPALANALNVSPAFAVPIGALSASSATYLIGRTAVGFYRGELVSPAPAGVAVPSSAA